VNELYLTRLKKTLLQAAPPEKKWRCWREFFGCKAHLHWKEITPPAKTLNLATPLFFKTRIELLHLNPLPLNSAREQALSDATKKDPATGGTARKGLTPPEETRELVKLSCTGTKQHRLQERCARNHPCG